MSRYDARLVALEEAVSPERTPQVCVVFGDDDVDNAVARLRDERNWPDDGKHPVKVICVRWGKG